MKSFIHIKELTLQINLGWPEEERQQKQTVLVDIDIHFGKPPMACVTDDLSDTFCYDQLIQHLHRETSKKPYRLLEHLTSELYQMTKQLLPDDTKVFINITKHPVIQGLNGGVRFSYGD